MISYILNFYLYEHDPEIGSTNTLTSNMLVSAKDSEYARALGDSIASNMKHPEGDQSYFWCDVEEADW